MRTAAFAFPAILAMTPVPALAFCFEPSPPYCARSFGSFTSEWEYDSCLSEMKRYREDVEDYLSCNNREAERAVEEARRKNRNAIDEYENAVDRFNSRVGR